MPDLDERLRLLDGLEPPELWDDIRTREPGRRVEARSSGRWMAAAVAAVLAVLGIGLAARAFLAKERTANDPAPPPGVSPVVVNGEIWFRRGGGEGGVWIEAVDPDGSNRRVLFRDPYAGGTDDVGMAYDWSPDGSQVAFLDSTGYIGEVPTGSSWDVFVMNADGSGRRQVTDDGGFDAAPAWSRDGARIAYASDRSDSDRPACEMDRSCNVDIYVVNVDGTDQTRLTSQPGKDWQPDWGPDGRVVFVSDRDDPDGDIYVMNADGTGVIRLTSSPGHDWQPRWSPDATRIAFVRQEGEPFGLYVMDADGANQRRLAGGLPASHSVEPDVFNDFAWSPDGTVIAFIGGDVEYPDTLFVIGADGSGLQQIAAQENIGLSGPAWRPVRMVSPADVTSPASRECPVGLIRHDHVTPAEAVRLMRQHVPTTLPPGFGVQVSSEFNGGAQLILTDERCRTVTVLFVPTHDPTVPSDIVDRVGPWVVEYDEPDQCGNFVLGKGRCTGYWAAAREGWVRVQTIGLSRAEADAVVRSIPL